MHGLMRTLERRNHKAFVLDSDAQPYGITREGERFLVAMARASVSKGRDRRTGEKKTQ